MDTATQKKTDTELEAMRAWARMVDQGTAPVFVAKGVPVADQGRAFAVAVSKNRTVKP